MYVEIFPWIGIEMPISEFLGQKHSIAVKCTKKIKKLYSNYFVL